MPTVNLLARNCTQFTTTKAFRRGFRGQARGSEVPTSRVRWTLSAGDKQIRIYARLKRARMTSS